LVSSQTRGNLAIIYDAMAFLSIAYDADPVIIKADDINSEITYLVFYLLTAKFSGSDIDKIFESSLLCCNAPSGEEK
jgi:hypothetical protein